MTTGEWILQHLQLIKVERTTAEIAERVKVSQNTARKWLYRLHEQKQVVVRQKFYGRGIFLYLWKFPDNGE